MHEEYGGIDGGFDLCNGFVFASFVAMLGEICFSKNIGEKPSNGF